MGQGIKRFTDLRAWQVCDVYKKAILRLCESGTLARDFDLRRQLENSASAPTDHVAEGFGRFSPPDFARFVVMARSSLMESQNQLRTAVDKHHITEATRLEHDQLAEAALEQITGLMEYLQSPEALRKAREARDRRDAKRAARKLDTRTSNPEPNRELNPEPNPEPNPEHRTEQRTRTENREPRTENG